MRGGVNAGVEVGFMEVRSSAATAVVGLSAAEAVVCLRASAAVVGLSAAEAVVRLVFSSVRLKQRRISIQLL